MQIYILNRARETLATTASIYDDKHTLTLEAGSSSYEFTIDKSDEASKYLDSGNYIVLQDDAGKAWLFTILDYEETHSTKTVYAEDAGIELINKAMDIWPLDGPHSFEYYFNLVTKDTPWKLGINQLEGLSRSLKYDGRDTGLGRLLSILKGFDDAECTFDVTVKMNAPADFKINVYKKVGSDRSDVQIVYNSELNDIKKKESRAEFVTALAGVGGQIQSEDGTDKGNVDFSDLEYNKDGFVTTKGDKFLRAVNANRTFNPGHESYIENFYEYDTQSPSELLNRTLSRLKIYSEPQCTYNAEVKVIDSSLVIGDTVTILDHDYNPALYLSARVAKLMKSYTDPTRNEIEFTNYRLLTSSLSDKLAKIQVMVNTLPSAAKVQAIETNLGKVIKQQEELTVQIKSADGKSTNFYGSTAPINPRQGDSWFYTDEEGNQGIKQYQDGVWVDVISSKFGPKIEADIKQAQADAEALSSEVESAKKQAQEAFAKAGFNADEISNVKTATSEVTETLTSTVRQASELSESLKNVASETASQYSTVSSELSGARNSLNAKASELASEIASNSANITKANSQLYSQSEGLAKVSQSATKMEQTMTDLSGRVHTVETTASETKETLADAKGNITTLTKRADGTDTKIADAQGRVQTLESRAGKWDLELSKKVDNTTYNAGIQNLGNQINLKANKSDLDGYATKAQLSVESDRITQQAGEIVTVRNLANNANDKIDGLRIGGRNLLKGTSDQFKTISNGGWMWAHTYSNYPYVDLSNFHTGDYLTYSVWVHNTSDVPIRAEIYCFNNSKAHSVTGISNNIISAGNYGWLTVTMQIGSNDYYARPSVITTAGQTGSHTIEMREEMLTLGNVRLPWQPSDLDLPNTIVSTVTIATNAKQIVDSSGIYSEVTKLVDTKVGSVTTQLETYKHTVDDTGDKLRDVMGALKLDSNGNLTSNFNELIKTASGVEERYTQLNSKIDGIVVGGKNLLDNSDGQLIMGYGIDNTTWTNGKATLVYNHNYSKTNKSSEILPQTGSRNQWYRVNKDEELTQSIIVETDATYNPNGVYQFTWFTAEFSHRLITANVDVLGTNKYRLWCSFKWDKDQSCNMRILDIQNLTRVLQINTSGTYISFYHPQIERGNKPSDWGMSDNDINQKVAEANASIAKTNETIKTVDGNVTTVKNNLDKTKSVVTQLANLFSVKVGESGVSVSSDGVLISGKKIHITGDTLIDNASIDGAKIRSLDAGKITAGTLNASKVNVINLNADNITAGTLNSALLKTGQIVSQNRKTIFDLDKASIVLGSTDSATNGTGTLTNGGIYYKYTNTLGEQENASVSLGYISEWNNNHHFPQWVLDNQKKNGNWRSGELNISGPESLYLHANANCEIVLKDVSKMSKGHTYQIGDDQISAVSSWINQGNLTLHDNDSNGVIRLSKNTGRDGKFSYISLGNPSLKWSGAAVEGRPSIVDSHSGDVAIGADNLILYEPSTDPKITDGGGQATLFFQRMPNGEAVIRSGVDANATSPRALHLYGGSSELLLETNLGHKIPGGGAFYVDTLNGNRPFIMWDRGVNIGPTFTFGGYTEINSNGLLIKSPMNLAGNWLGCGSLSVSGAKNAVVKTSQGWTKINAYETTEYYFGDIGTVNTGETKRVKVVIDSIFAETVNTKVPYHVFLTKYGKGDVWVSERNENYFVIESDTPNLEVDFEIKAKRLGYEDNRLEVDKNMEMAQNAK